MRRLITGTGLVSDILDTINKCRADGRKLMAFTGVHNTFTNEKHYLSLFKQKKKKNTTCSKDSFKCWRSILKSWYVFNFNSCRQIYVWDIFLPFLFLYFWQYLKQYTKASHIHIEQENSIKFFVTDLRFLHCIPFQQSLLLFICKHLMLRNQNVFFDVDQKLCLLNNEEKK